MTIGQKIWIGSVCYELIFADPLRASIFARSFNEGNNKIYWIVEDDLLVTFRRKIRTPLSLRRIG
jgi:hypothetical protein